MIEVSITVPDDTDAKVKVVTRLADERDVTGAVTKWVTRKGVTFLPGERLTLQLHDGVKITKIEMLPLSRVDRAKLRRRAEQLNAAGDTHAPVGDEQIEQPVSSDKRV